MEMAQLTLDLMMDFQRRVLEYVASVMTSIAPIISLI